MERREPWNDMEQWNGGNLNRGNHGTEGTMERLYTCNHGTVGTMESLKPEGTMKQ